MTQPFVRKAPWASFSLDQNWPTDALLSEATLMMASKLARAFFSSVNCSFDGVRQLALALQPEGDADQAGMAANGDPALVFRLPQVAVAGLAVFQLDDGAVEGDRLGPPVAGRQIALARHHAAHAGGTLDGAVDAAVELHLEFVERLDQIELHVVRYAVNRRHDDVETGTARGAELVQQLVIGAVFGQGRLDAGLLLEIGQHLGRDVARPCEDLQLTGGGSRVADDEGACRRQSGRRGGTLEQGAAGEAFRRELGCPAAVFFQGVAHRLLFSLHDSVHAGFLSGLPDYGPSGRRTAISHNRVR